MSTRSTNKESRVTRDSKRVGVLTYVLSFDDLGSDRSVSLVLPASSHVVLGGDERGQGPPRFASEHELVIFDPYISTRHATLLASDADRFGSGALLRDEGSRNGTFVNGSRVRGTARLADGDLVCVGHSLLCYRAIDEAIAERLVDRGPTRLGPTSTRCPDVARVAEHLERIAPTREPVLILGETGTGKESIARATHELSGRSGAYVTVDCGAVPESLFESTFFGHRRGAFTGATESQIGVVARASRGTLFLDEVANMSPGAQAKLLRVIEEGHVVPVGASEGVDVDVRWVAATNKPNLAGEPSFRADLLRRLAGIAIKTVPLRRRREDLGALAAHALADAGIARASMRASSGRAFFARAFPGNIRELRATLRAAAILAGDRPIDDEHLAAVDLPEPSASREDDDPMVAAERRNATPRMSPSREVVEEALRHERGNVVRAAARLEVHARQVYRWIERYGLALDRYRS